MNERELSESAALIPRASSRAAAAYAASAETLAAEVTARMLAKGDIERLAGQHNLSLLPDIHRKQARFLASTLADFDPARLVRTVVWAIRTHKAVGIREGFWAAQQDAWREALAATLEPGAAAEAAPLHEWLRSRMDDLIRASETRPGTKECA